MRLTPSLPLLLTLITTCAFAQEVRVKLAPQLLTNEAAWGNPAAIIDEQDAIGDPPKAQPRTPWDTDWRHAKDFPISAHLDLGQERHLSVLWVYDINDQGPLDISVGRPGQWQKLTSYKTEAYMSWAKVSLDVTTRYLRLTRATPGCQFTEIALYEYTPQAWQSLQDRKAAEAKAAEAKRQALARAQEEARNRPLIDLGLPFGRLPLVDEIDCAAEKPDHLFTEFPPTASRSESILNQPARTIAPRPGEASYLSWRIGRYKLLKPGSAYLLTVEYPEDAPRSMIVLNGGCETIRGFHTGATVGDALRSKYVWSNPECLRVPLSNQWQTWKQLFFLHDRFPERSFIRGSGPRTLTPDDGFPVTIAQFSAENDPPSHGIAVRRIRLFEVPDPRRLSLPINFPPDGLPRRQIFWREEMADGVIDSAKPEERGLVNPLDWYRHKAALMHFLGINTYTKDLLEFGACQHWDPTPAGGHDWVFYSDRHKDLWGNLVDLMGREGFTLLPYYEYSGSRGYKGLGPQRRAKPLTRDDAYTHIQWIEQSNADITDPDTLADFKKMLDLTVLRFKDKARFTGIWIRPRSQLPIGFGDATRSRFAKEANNGQEVTRPQLIADKALKQRYYDWWFAKRRAFLEAMRDHLRQNSVNPDAVVLFTADASEPGPAFPTWDKKLVTDDPASCTDWLKLANAAADRPITLISFTDVVSQKNYLQALTSPPLDWGKWEVSHASPPADPQHYTDTPGLLLTHGFHRAYSVSSPDTFDAFRTPAGLALVRHYSLNENMLFDKAGKDLLGYFVADIERAGPHCMLAEALAVANGDPTHLGYLTGNSYNRGFPEPVRDFHAAYLSLPALPSRRLPDASSDPQIVVRSISTPNHGAWLAIVNTALTAKSAVKIRLPAPGQVTDAVTNQPIPADNGIITLDLAPCQLRSLRLR